MPTSASSRNELHTSMGFQTTHWTVVLEARAANNSAAGEALTNLCSVYLDPLYAFIRRSGYTSHDAEDLTQGFFYSFLRRDSLMRVSPLAGKFRSYLLLVTQVPSEVACFSEVALSSGGMMIPAPAGRQRIAASYLLAITAVALEHQDRFSGAFVTNGTARAATGKGKLWSGHNEASLLATLAVFSSMVWVRSVRVPTFITVKTLGAPIS